ncbi:MAG: hypothetical protein LBE20_04270 [Deltaproteobacteria bacterium]|jgi:Tfp pilus assembly protein PilV|nr:hypothetical protein [Deltaproteobacteria bacterium]
MNKLNQRGATLIETLFATLILTVTLTIGTYKIAELQKLFIIRQTKIEQIHLLDQAKNLITWSNSDSEIIKYLNPSLKNNTTLTTQCQLEANTTCTIEIKTVEKQKVYSYVIKPFLDNL